MKLLKNLKISGKLGVVFGINVLILLAISISSIIVLNNIEKQGKDLTESLKLSDNISDAKYNLTWDKQLIMEVLASDTKEAVDEQQANFNIANSDFDAAITAIYEVGSDKKWGNGYADVKEKIVKFANNIDQVHNKEILPMLNKMPVMQNELIALRVKRTAMEGTIVSLEETTQLTKRIEELETELSASDKAADILINKINESIISTQADIVSIVEGTTKETNDLVAFSNTAISISSIIAVILAILISISLTNIIARPLRDAVVFAENISNGDLTAEIALNQKDEVGELVNSLRRMSGKLKEVVSAIITSSQNISSASSQMSSTAQEMSEGATEQASSVEEISSSMEEMAANIQQNTNNSKQTEKIASNAAKDVVESNEAVTKTVDSMKTIATKISIIGEISRQTNLLALNAAVEAARAGEHGKGFAVVAAEVRKLAERSQLAATEINEVSAMSVDIAQKSGDLLKTVVPNIQKTSDLVQEITASSVEQNAGADQINNAIQQLNQVVQQNAAAAEEMAAGSEELSTQAKYLTDVIAFFKTDANNNVAQHAAVSTKKSIDHKRNGMKEMKRVSSNGVHKPISSKTIRLDAVESNESEYESF